MVRPRLVEEGKPIGQADDDDHHDDHEMVDHSSSFQGMEYTEQFAHHQSATSYAAHATATTDKPSSLLAAAKGKLPSKRRPRAAHATRVIIGDESPASWQPDCIDMTTDSHARTSDYPPPPPHYDSHQNYDSSSTSAQPMHQYQQQPRQYSPPPTSQHHYQQSPHRPAHSHTQHIEIGADTRPTERMEGVQDHSIKTPLIVLDGANVAYAYSQTAHAAEYQHQGNSRGGGKIEPDATGIRVACDYFLKAEMRVMVVLPAPWFRSKPRPGDASHGNASMLTDQLEVLQELQQSGRVLAAPPSDDDDAYALTIARRENVRAAARNGQGPGYVLSNDMFRDAQARDPTGQVRPWLTAGHNQDTGPGRISFAFCDMGTMNDYGETELDIVPNPRHPLISWIEHQHAQQHTAT
jgi:hypothetical protein